jgi:hypothetical protein
MKENQDKQNSWGGVRPNAGRPKGKSNKPKIRDYMTPAEVKELVEMAKQQAKDKPEILKWLLEQVFGKATQPVSGEDGNALIVQFNELFSTPRKTSGDNQKQ